MTNPKFIKAPCKCEVRIKVWKAGFSLKCLNPKRSKTQVVTPYSEQYFRDSLSDFCKGCFVTETKSPETPELSLDASEGVPASLVVESRGLVVAKDRERDNSYVETDEAKQ